MTDLLEFYRGTGTDIRGRTFDDILAFSDDEMEKVHDFIQWIFPLPETSFWNPDAPLLTPEDIAAFSESSPDHLILIHQVSLACARYMQFLANTESWRRPTDHNHLRITRALRFLTLAGNTGLAHLLHAYCVDAHPGLPDRTLWFWAEAQKESPAYLTEKSA
jgi:hypothetical protein